MFKLILGGLIPLPKFLQNRRGLTIITSVFLGLSAWVLYGGIMSGSVLGISLGGGFTAYNVYMLYKIRSDR